MSGPRILLAVAVVAALLVYLAFGGARDADLLRGQERTEEAFAHVERELQALQPAYEALRGQGLVLGLREQHDLIRQELARLRGRRVTLLQDPELDPRERLPRLNELVDEIDGTLAMAIDLRRTCEALVEFRRATEPLLARARRQRDSLAALADPGTARAARRAALAGSLEDLDGRVQLTDRLLRQNLAQGRTMGAAVAGDLQRLLAEQSALLAEQQP